MILTAWGLAGIAGPTIYDVILKQTGSLETTLTVFSVMFVVALVVSLLMNSYVNRAYKKQAEKQKLVSATA
jgi:OFA family oxalate/formate antiporter-like MFS transporter